MSCGTSRIRFTMEVRSPRGARRRAVRSCRSSVAQWQSIRLLTGGLLVRVQPEEPTSPAKLATSGCPQASTDSPAARRSRHESSPRSQSLQSVTAASVSHDRWRCPILCPYALGQTRIRRRLIAEHEAHRPSRGLEPLKACVSKRLMVASATSRNRVLIRTLTAPVTNRFESDLRKSSSRVIRDRFCR
jgi:hypothetical protein